MRPSWLISAGTAICLLVWLAPLHDLGLGHFSSHMLRHMSVVTFGALLIAAGLRIVLPSISFAPLAASLAEFVVVWGWHLPALHDAARSSVPVYVLEQGSFLTVGLVLWISVFQAGWQLAGAGALLLTSMHMTLLGTLITLSPQQLYEGAGLTGQQIGGMLMLAIGTPVYLFAGLALVGGALRGNPGHKGELT